MKMEFKNKTFCFTGTFVDCERTDAILFAKMRGGFIVEKRVSKDLDYLIVGSEATKSWKFGDFGHKINDALHLREKFNKPKIISEQNYLKIIEDIEPIKDRIIENNKILFMRIVCKIDEEDIETLKTYDSTIYKLSENLKFYFTLNSFNIAFDNIFENQSKNQEESILSITIRILKLLNLEESTKQITDIVINEIKSLNLNELKYTITERKEGSILYGKLYNEIIKNKK